MDNKDIHIGLLGAGKIGTAIYNLLIASGFGYDITVGDQRVLNSITTCDFHRLELHSDYTKECSELDKFVKGKTLIINALPYQLNPIVYKYCVEHNIPYFDLSEDEFLDEWIEKKEYLSPTRTGILFTMPHCGLAPGLSTVIANDLVKDFYSVYNLKIRVGALSQHSSNKLKYHTSWSSDGLVNEYKGNCQVVDGGVYVKVPALCGHEKLTINGQDYEAFNTSGGIGTFAKTLAEQDKSCIYADYKTIRRIGHLDYIDFLFNDLRLKNDMLVDIFRNHVTQTTKDCVIIFVEVNGQNKILGYTGKIYTKTFYPDMIQGRTFTAIELTTAVGLLAMVELFLNKKLPQEGYVKQESVEWQDILDTKYGWIYRESPTL